MTDPLLRLNSLCRPKILVRAARIGSTSYNRRTSLRRLLPGETPPPPGQAFEVLFEREHQMDIARREGGAAYSAARHVEILSALIHEARLAGLRAAA